LAELGQQVAEIDGSLLDVCKRADKLTVYSWVFRYPGEPSEPTVSDAREALELAQEVMNSILERLPAQARPNIR
jgi:hypothetical protein